MRFVCDWMHVNLFKCWSEGIVIVVWYRIVGRWLKGHRKVVTESVNHEYDSFVE